MGKLKIVVAIPYSCYTWEEIEEENIEKQEDVGKFTYKIPKGNIKVYIFANAVFVEADGERIKDVFSL